MAKFLLDAIMDAALAYITANAATMTICSAQPTNRTEAIATYALADVAVVGGDFTLANGDVSGRKVTVAAKSAIPIDASGDATHVAIVSATELLVVTTVTLQTLTSGNTADLGAWDVEIQDPV